MTADLGPLVPILEALVWIETRSDGALEAFRGRKGSGFDDLFGVDPAARLYPEMAAQSRAKARADLGLTSIEPDPLGALLREARAERLLLFGRRDDGAPLEQIPGLQWSAHGGLQLKAGYTGLAAFWPGKSETAAFIWISVDAEQLLRIWPEQGAKRRGRPPTKASLVKQAIDDLREEGVDVDALGDKALARKLKAAGVNASPRTLGRIKRGA